MPKHRRKCRKINAKSQRCKDARKDLREAFGVRPACWRGRKVWGGPKAGASSAHSKRSAQFGCGIASAERPRPDAIFRVLWARLQADCRRGKAARSEERRVGKEG